MKRILIVDDDSHILDLFQEAFRDEPYDVHALSEPDGVLACITQKKPDLVILDIHFGPGRERAGLDILEQLRLSWDEHQLPVIIISGDNVNVDRVTESMEKGANDILKKPVRLKELKSMVARMLQTGSVDPSQPWHERMVGVSTPILEVIKRIMASAKFKRDTLFSGETGTGKDLAARCYHQHSPWCRIPLVTIYCSAIPTTLFEAEMFGHRPDAFHRAHDRVGRIQAGDHGIIFLNEIGDLPLDQQSKLLNLIENKTITQLGSNQVIQLDIVILMATNRNLSDMVERGEFRADLYNRLCGNEILIPPLRERQEDIPELVMDFIRKFNLVYQRQVQQVDPQVWDFFQRLPWEGNVRQLMHCVEFGVECCLDQTLRLEDVQGFFANQHAPNRTVPDDLNYLKLDYAGFQAEEKQRIQKWRRDYFEYHLNRHLWNVAATARALGIGRKNLDNLIKACGLQRKSMLQHHDLDKEYSPGV